MNITLPSTIMAGDQIAMHVLARDLHGNTTNWLGGERIAVHARGPTEIPFIPSESVGSFRDDHHGCRRVLSRRARR